MTRSETIGIIEIIRRAYPRFVEASAFEPDIAKAITGTVDLWHEMLSDLPTRIVTAAVKAFIATDTKGFPPVIGAIREIANRFQNPNELSDTDAWQLVTKAVSNCAYGYAEEWDKLPPQVQRTIGSRNVLREWAMVHTQEFQTVIQSHFLRAYRDRVTRAREMDCLPVGIGNILRSLPEHQPSGGAL